MRRRHRLLVAAGLLAPACSPAPTAHRGARSSASPSAEAGPGATVAIATTSTGPAPTSPAGAASTPAPAGPTTTAYVVTVPTDPPTTTTVRPRPLPTTTLPELVDDAMGDVEWLIRQTFFETPDKAVRVASCESRLNPRAVNGQHIGVMQVATLVHADLIADMGYEPADLLDLAANLRVARAVYDGADGGPKGWAAWTCAA